MPTPAASELARRIADLLYDESDVDEAVTYGGHRIDVELSDGTSFKVTVEEAT